MSREYFIHDALGQRRIGEMELPLQIGGKALGGIVLPGVPEEHLSAYLALSEGHVYLQPVDSGPIIFLNDERLASSAWLKSGDRIQIDRALLNWTIKGDKVFIDVIQQPDKQHFQPPSQPPEDEPNSADNDMPVRSEEKAVKHNSTHTRVYIFSVVGLLLLAAIYLLVATPVVIQLEPAAQTLKMKGFPPPLHLWGSRLTLPGRYTIEAYQPGYAPFSEQVDIHMDGTTTLNFTLTELPGQLQVSSNPVTEFKLLIDEAEPGFDKNGRAQISRGPHQLRVLTERHLPHEQQIEILGYGQVQPLLIDLQPAWANISISSKPAKANVLVDGELIGQTPLIREILHGQRNFQLQLSGFKTTLLTQRIEAGKDTVLPPFQLLPVDGKLSIESQPDKANVTLDGIFQGMTPIDLDISSNIGHSLKLTKSGYTTVEKTISLKPDETTALNIKFNAVYATIFLTTYPAGATLSIDGKAVEKQNGRFRLSARPHSLSLSKPGYITRKLTITPQQGVSQNIEIKLVTQKQQRTKSNSAVIPPSLTTSAGQVLNLIKPETHFTMGASRREAGRRANESRRLVRLARPFYLATKETTNHEYRLFQADHHSGSLDGANLDGENQPVVHISWDDAARYCNWLSQKQNLPAAYIEKKGKMIAVEPMNTGYRLPTEAEWAWVSRRHKQSTELRYPWVGGYPPEKVNGNYADHRIADTLSDVVPDYDDGYRGTATVGTFPAWPAGFYDLGGNVAEWIHDYYALYPGEATQLVTDPHGPNSANHHVVRGAGWRHGNITELRLSYRDYSNKPRYDLGFRIARYAQ